MRTWSHFSISQIVRILFHLCAKHEHQHVENKHLIWNTETFVTTISDKETKTLAHGCLFLLELLVVTTQYLCVCICVHLQEWCTYRHH